jgi:hypothetical protein
MKSRSCVTKGVRLLSPSARVRLLSSFNHPHPPKGEEAPKVRILGGKTFSLKTKLLSHFGVFKSGRSWAFGVVGGAKERRKGVFRLIHIFPAQPFHKCHLILS